MGRRDMLRANDRSGESPEKRVRRTRKHTAKHTFNSPTDTLNETPNETLPQTLNETPNETLPQTLNETLTDTHTQTLKQTLTDTLTQVARRGGRYDPDAPLGEKLRVRRGYSALLREVREHRAALAQPDSARLRDVLGEADALLADVHTTAEAALDARLVAMTADIGAERAGRLAADAAPQGFSVAELVRAATASDEVGRAWRERVVPAAARAWRGVAVRAPLVGHFALSAPAGLPERVRRQRGAQGGASSSAHEAAVSPATGDAGDATRRADRQTDERIRYVAGALAALGRPVPLYAFVTDPRSLGRSVENLFYVAFLVNEGRVRLWWEPRADTDEPHLMVASAEPGADGERRQMICRMSGALWRRARALYDLQAPMIDFPPGL